VNIRVKKSLLELYVNTLPGVNKLNPHICLRKTTITTLKTNIFKWFKNQKNHALSAIGFGFERSKTSGNYITVFGDSCTDMFSPPCISIGYQVSTKPCTGKNRVFLFFPKLFALFERKNGIMLGKLQNPKFSHDFSQCGH